MGGNVNIGNWFFVRTRNKDAVSAWCKSASAVKSESAQQIPYTRSITDALLLQMKAAHSHHALLPFQTTTDEKSQRVTRTRTYNINIYALVFQMQFAEWNDHGGEHVCSIPKKQHAMSDTRAPIYAEHFLANHGQDHILWWRCRVKRIIRETV